MSTPKSLKLCSSCTECQHSRQRCFFETLDATECSRCIARGLKCIRRLSVQGSRKKQKCNSSIVDKDQGGVDILDRQTGVKLSATVFGPPSCSVLDIMGRSSKNQIARSTADKDQGGVDILDRQTGVKLSATVFGPPPCSALDIMGRSSKNQIAISTADKDQGGVDILDRQTGVKLSATVFGPPSCSESVVMGLFAKNQVDICKTYTQGGGDVWYPTPSGELMHFRPTNRFTCPTNGDPLFLRASCIHNLKRCSSGSLVVFRTKGTDSFGWRLGILDKLHYLPLRGGAERKGGAGPGAVALTQLLGLSQVMDCGDGSIGLWQWKGEPTGKELRFRLHSQFTPELMHSQSWREVLTHMEYKKFRLDDIRLYYLNQIKGQVPLGLSVAQDTRNLRDGGIQSSICGPDLWKKQAARVRDSGGLNINFNQFKFREGDLQHPNLLVFNKMMTGVRWKKKRDGLGTQIDKNSDAYQWHTGSPKKIPAQQHMCLLVIVKDKLGRNLSPGQAGAVPSLMEMTLNYGSIVGANDKKSSAQSFFCLSHDANKKLCEEYSDGMPLGEHHMEEIDEVLRRYANDNVHNLFSTDKAYPHPAHFHGFTRIFAGEETPPTDESFSVGEVMPEHSVHFKFVQSREYSQYPALSTGFHDSTFHHLRIQHSFVRMIEKALGRSGGYVGRCTNIHEGHLSFVGPRKVGRMNQPTVQEGPQEKSYWYHNQKNDHRYLPFVISLVNLLGGATTVAPYYFYRHLKQLYERLNSTDTRSKFCPRAILTIDFYNSCHTDKNDLDRNETNQMVTRLEDIITVFDQLTKRGLKVMQSRMCEAVKSLAHLTYWGFCLPTTCCYQYLFKTSSKVEVYQWFMCPGLGTTHRIRNYWVHIMLGGLFSHCTSAPVYIVNNTAYFGKCPNVTMFAWGGN